MRLTRLALVIFVAVLVAPATAAAVSPSWPLDGMTTDSTPSFEWQLAPGEEASFLELSPDPAPGPSFGWFAENADQRTHGLGSHQTSFRVPGSRPLLAGDWYWHVRATELVTHANYWSTVRRIRVQDDRIKLRDFELEYLRCAKSVYVEAAYFDNNRSQEARWRLDFRTLRGGRRIARMRGTEGDGNIMVARSKPRRLRRGKRYVARLFLRDSAGHVTRSRYRRIRITRC